MIWHKSATNNGEMEKVQVPGHTQCETSHIFMAVNQQALLLFYSKELLVCSAM